MCASPPEWCSGGDDQKKTRILAMQISDGKRSICVLGRRTLIEKQVLLIGFDGRSRTRHLRSRFAPARLAHTEFPRRKHDLKTLASIEVAHPVQPR
jgi:hypothetical protein